MGTLLGGTRVTVLRCEDIKTDVVPRLDEAGVEGYVTRERYRLEKKPIWSSWSGPIASGRL